ncbi:hypothetical protein [Caballeronia sp. ATUFL_M1_KS5A]|uniref:hypothetical protein n=1 Tax=Caballeronia sp. ATUFL_M1_KS5A TaxID=2921778 RepID=UPI00202942BA|nr:hypothetical protein [Caballeronia sp. ATUFL_M1_KS5A]
MIVYHGDAAFEPNVTRSGNVFVATASILEKDGRSTPLGELGYFANEQSAMRFALLSATAFIEGAELPLSPVRLSA